MEIRVEGTLPRAFGLTKREVERGARAFAEASRRRGGGGAGEWLGVTVWLIGDEESDECHREVMGIEGATDVITQAYGSIPPEPEGMWGELYVNTDRAMAAAPKRRGWSAAKELLLYVAHGMDHLGGADDATPEEYARMRRRELRWLKSAKF